ncbi:MAG: NAD(P)H-dependent oxidoreductase [Candidatus Yanofskybacteria bacterium]|nr:NAD(P)H-dependent oxidoreductase [Candidatus Yanofskybacteria bacterium]
MNEKLFIPILLGTVRKERQSEKVAQFLLEQVSKHPEIETELFDPREMDLPMDDEGGYSGLKEKNTKWRDAIIRADGLIIVTPEYNHGYPGSLKRALDVLLKEYIHKTVGLVGVSAGRLGGARVIEQLVQVVRELGLAVTFTDLSFPGVGDFFDEKGEPKDKAVYGRVEKFLEELVWMAKTLRWGRQNVSSKHHQV